MQGSNQGQRRTGTAAIFPCCLFFFFLSCWIGKLESTRASDGVGKGTKTKPRRGRESRPRRQPLLACRFRRRWRLTNSIFRTEIVCSLPSATGLDRVCSWISTGRDLSLARKVESHGRARSAPSFFFEKRPAQHLARASRQPNSSLYTCACPGPIVASRRGVVQSERALHVVDANVDAYITISANLFLSMNPSPVVNRPKSKVAHSSNGQYQDLDIFWALPNRSNIVLHMVKYGLYIQRYMPIYTVMMKRFRTIY